MWNASYAGMLARDIANGADPKLVNITPEEVNKCRKTLRQKIWVEKGRLENNGKQANKTKTMNVCGRYVNHTCWRGKNCTLEHPVLCDSDVHKRYCRETPCNLYHPQICSANWCHKVCKWGVECKFRHLKNDVQRYDHEYNKCRRDSHYDHHGNHLKGQTSLETFYF